MNTTKSSQESKSMKKKINVKKNDDKQIKESYPNSLDHLFDLMLNTYC